jgi:hypothetical protein
MPPLAVTSVRWRAKGRPPDTRYRDRVYERVADNVRPAPPTLTGLRLVAKGCRSRGYPGKGGNKVPNPVRVASNEGSRNPFRVDHNARRYQGSGQAATLRYLP